MASRPGEGPTKEMFDTMVRIRVGKGDTQEEFEAHRGVLCYYSGYFQRAFNGKFAEAQEGEVTLPTEDPAVFEVFLYWLYNKRFSPNSELLESTTICKLWIFGDAHNMPFLPDSAAS
ncbi:hypothetical protein LTR36_001742 [Oleoguttula mirabilis]|uniref:BTB domain-containing protein n=1 Tax=Oleoguttula mirabilis TaxID=1507867 RepID=A0AAV9JLY3_9PEZI|nr:hypothetical protein LTR36_001742 [Oleoguttula mirabilis]